jgi:thiamine-phosphate pyrophosphorylase
VSTVDVLKPSLLVPPLYPILDAGLLRSCGISIEDFASTLRRAGIRFLQYRDKDSADAGVLHQSGLLRGIFPSHDSTLILNDRVHLLESSGFDGVHVGQDDLSAQQARAIIGSSRILGLSTHNEEQLTFARLMPVDYIAIGPVFATRSKANPDPTVGLAGVREARRLTSKPLIAIGGITPENARLVLDAGADSIALISALLPTPTRSMKKVLEDFLATIG